jgi:hypothetical protein
MPCKHRRPGSIPGVSTCAIGIEEDGNLPDSDFTDDLPGHVPMITDAGRLGAVIIIDGH